MNGMIKPGADQDDIVTGGADCMPVNSKNCSKRSEVPPQSYREQVGVPTVAFSTLASRWERLPLQERIPIPVRDKSDGQCENQKQVAEYSRQQPQRHCHPVRYSSDYNNDEAFPRSR